MAAVSGRNIILGSLVALAAVFYQYLLKDVLFVTYGVGRQMQKLSEFPYQCRKIHDRQIEACEDMWLDEESRTLYLACSDPMSRIKWMPNIAKFDVEHRSLNDHIVAMSIDKPTPDGSYEYTVLKPTGYAGAGGESALYLVGMTGRSLPSSTVELYLINTQPSFHPNHTLKDQLVHGSNSTIEVFHTTPGTGTMTHVRTFFHPQLATPNNVAVMPDGSIYFTNDHGLNRAGWRHNLSPAIRSGNVAHCTTSYPPVCKPVAHNFAFPNGLHYSPRQDKLFVPSAALGDIHVYRPLPSEKHKLEFLETIKLPYPIDNLSEDSDGAIIAAVLPKSGELFEKFKDWKYADIHRGSPEVARFKQLKEMGKQPASAAFRVRRVGKGVDGEGYRVEKLIEDREGEVLPASTTVIRDGRTGRLFAVGVVSEWISVCEGKQMEE